MFDSESVKMDIELPDGFNEVAARFLMEPERLAFLICADFAQHAPARLTLVESTLPAGRASLEMAALDRA